MKPLLISSGEPAGIGPDICLALADCDIPLVVMADMDLLIQRSHLLKKNIHFQEYNPNQSLQTRAGELTVLHSACAEEVLAGQLNVKNSPYVLRLLKESVERCMAHEFSGLVTAPVHKAIINKSGFPFTGHTEFLAKHCKVDTVVMMLACEELKVALVTTHLPLRAVPDAITKELIIDVIEELQLSLRRDFNSKDPKIKVAGLNPHAGESGYLGKEEIEIIHPALEQLRLKKIDVEGPLPADTMFSHHHQQPCDAYVTMYHDQGLPVLKFAGFGRAVNITLGLPIIRTSVDHGTALDLAATGKAEASSLLAAVQMAYKMACNRKIHE